MGLIIRGEVHTSDVLLNNNLFRGSPTKVASCRVPARIYGELEDAAKRLNVPLGSILTYLITNYSNHFVFLSKDI